MDKKTDLQKTAVRLVAEQIINMLDNNILHDSGVEGFEGWCEDGDVFYNNEGLSMEQADAATKLMRGVAPLVDKLTYEYINFGY